MYGIRLVGDAELPAGHDFVLVQTRDAMVFFARESAMCAGLIEEMWAAYRAAADSTPAPSGPERRPRAEREGRGTRRHLLSVWEKMRVRVDRRLDRLVPEPSLHDVDRYALAQ